MKSERKNDKLRHCYKTQLNIKCVVFTLQLATKGTAFKKIKFVQKNSDAILTTIFTWLFQKTPKSIYVILVFSAKRLSIPLSALHYEIQSLVNRCEQKGATRSTWTACAAKNYATLLSYISNLTTRGMYV